MILRFLDIVHTDADVDVADDAIAVFDELSLVWYQFYVIPLIPRGIPFILRAGIIPAHSMWDLGIAFSGW